MLKPCQHCGNTATVEFKQRYDNHRYPREFWYARIECSMCDVMTDWRCVSEINASFYDIDSDAVDALCAAWNTRADEERIRREAIEECQKIVRKKQDGLNALAEKQNNIHVSEACEATFRFSVECIEEMSALADPRPESRSVVLDAKCESRGNESHKEES